MQPCTCIVTAVYVPILLAASLRVTDLNATISQADGDSMNRSSMKERCLSISAPNANEDKKEQGGISYVST